MSRAALLALADQRLPAGGHAHSGGVEQAVNDGLVRDVPTLHAFLRRRLFSAGLVSAGIACAATNLTLPTVGLLDAETDARTPSPAQREASRALGRGLLRLARAAWPNPGLSWDALGPRPHHPIVLGFSARAAGLDGEEAALVAAYLSVTGPATAAQRLLGLDPIAVTAVTLALSGDIENIAVSVAHERLADPAYWRHLPDDGDPQLDLLAERHAVRGDRLFAS